MTNIISIFTAKTSSMSAKTCRKCGHEKDINEFRDINNRGNIIKCGSCIECANQISRSYYRSVTKENRKKPPVIDMDGELWFDIIDFEGFYKISNKSRIKSVTRRVPGKSKEKLMTLTERIMNPSDNGNGYMTIGLAKNGKTYTKKVHQLVAKTFIPNPKNKPEVNHKNGCKNDNRIENLEWATKQENVDHKYEVLKYRHPSGANNKTSKPVIIIDEFGIEQKTASLREAAKIIGISASSICNVLKGKCNNSQGYKFKYA